MNKRSEDVLTGWVSWMRHNKGRCEGTLLKYRRYLGDLSDWLDAREKTIFSAERGDLEQFTGPVLHERGLTPRSRRPYVAAIRTFYKWARFAGIMTSDPSKGLVYPNIGRKLPRGMTLGNAEKLLMQPDLRTFIGVRDSAILHLFIGTGLRLSGLADLNEGDLLFTDSSGSELLVLRVTEKGDKERFVPVPSEARLMVRAYLGHPELDVINRELPDGNKVLFVSTANRTVPDHEYFGENRRLSTRSIQEMIEAYAHKAGIPRDQARPHALRHLYGTELAEDDVHLLKMQALMGHARADDTKIYTHVAMRSLAKTVEQANPLAKIRSPASDLARRLK